MKLVIRNFFVLFLFCSFSFISNGQNSSTNGTKIFAEDLVAMLGEWEGTLTYINYKDNQPFTIKSNIIVEATENMSQVKVQNIYPDEPKANDSYKLTLRKNGTYLNKSKVISRKELSDSSMEWIVQFKGKDNGKKALMRNVYLLTKETLTYRKDVQYKGTSEWFKRNEYAFKKKVQ